MATQASCPHGTHGLAQVIWLVSCAVLNLFLEEFVFISFLVQINKSIIICTVVSPILCGGFQGGLQGHCHVLLLAFALKSLLASFNKYKKICISLNY